MQTRPILLAFVALGLTSLGISAQSWSPDIATLQRLESSIQPSAYPKWGYAERAPVVTQYVRYYAGYRSDGHRLIAGEFVLPRIAREKNAGIHIVASEKEFPIIVDGGCGIVNVVYDVELGKMISLTCNGRA